MRKLNVLSLFDGLSGGRIALSRTNLEIENYFSSEIDKYCIQIADKNWPMDKNNRLGDVLNLDTTKLPKIDLLIGGSPCQSFTFAGKRDGMSTESKIKILTLDHYLQLKKEKFKFIGESYLFWEYMRILKEVKPKYFLLENVKMSKEWKDVLSNAIGFEPILINSNLQSAQNRQRLYWTNIPNITQPNDKNLLLKDIVIKEDVDNFDLSYKHHQGFLRSYKWRHRELNEKSNTLLASYYKQPPHSPYILREKSPSGFRRLTPLECERLQTLPDNYTEGVSNTQRYKMIGNGWTIDVISHIFKNII